MTRQHCWGLACALLLAACSSSSGGGGGDLAGVGGGTAGSGLAGAAAGVSGVSGTSGGTGTTAVAGTSGANGGAGAGAGTTAGASGTGGSAGSSGGIGVAGISGGGTGAAGSTAGAGATGTGAGGAAGASSFGPCDAVEVARVDNPFVGASGYVNPEWSAKAMGEPGGEAIANTPTGVWLDRIAAIQGTPNSQSNGPMGLRDHLDSALEQDAGYIQIVIYNLPGRDCSALASNGELGPNELDRYESEYIDAIVAVMSDPCYRELRIINIIEIDSLPNLVTNLNVAACAEMQANGGYVQGVAYALAQLGSLPNTYNYVDAAHHGWLGWDTNFGPAAQLFADTASIAGMENVHGFITNTANYSATSEPFLSADATVEGNSVRQSSWIDWNQYVDELTFAQDFRDQLVSLDFDPGIGMIIDTSRNGWGGAARPSAASTATDVSTFVDESRIDRRIHAGNWCNQAGAGLGERPQAAPAPGIDAYAWIKPPGESDGSSSEIPNDDGKGFDRMCDPTYGGNERNGNSSTGALPDAPISGAWFSAQFQQLMQNAHPPL